MTLVSTQYVLDFQQTLFCAKPVAAEFNFTRTIKYKIALIFKSKSSMEKIVYTILFLTVFYTQKARLGAVGPVCGDGVLDEDELCDFADNECCFHTCDGYHVQGYPCDDHDDETTDSICVSGFSQPSFTTFCKGVPTNTVVCGKCSALFKK